MARFVRAFGARVVSAGGSLVIVLVLAKFFGVEALGVFAVAHAFFVAGSLVATWGAGNALMKFVGADRVSAGTLRIIVFALKRAMWVGVVLGAVLAASAPWLADRFDMVELSPILVGVAVSIPLMGLVRVLSGIYKGLGRADIGCLLDNGGVLLAMSLLSVVSVWLNGEFANTLAVSYGIATLAFLVFGLVGLHGYWKQLLAASADGDAVGMGVHREDYKRYKSVAQDFLYVNCSSLLMHSGAFILAGLYLSKQDVGLLKAAQQVAVAVEFVQMVLNAIYPPKFARAWAKRNTAELRSLVHSCFVLGFWGAFPFYVVITLWPGGVLSLLDKALAQGGGVLILVATGQMVNVLTGPGAQLLGMTDYSRRMRNISIASYVLSFSVMVPLMEAFSVEGGAIALLLFIALPNVVALYYATKLVSIRVVPSFRDFWGITKRCVAINLGRT